MPRNLPTEVSTLNKDWKCSPISDGKCVFLSFERTGHRGAQRRRITQQKSYASVLLYVCTTNLFWCWCNPVCGGILIMIQTWESVHPPPPPPPPSSLYSTCSVYSAVANWYTFKFRLVWTLVAPMGGGGGGGCRWGIGFGV